MELHGDEGSSGSSDTSGAHGSVGVSPSSLALSQRHAHHQQLQQLGHAEKSAWEACDATPPARANRRALVAGYGADHAERGSLADLYVTSDDQRQHGRQYRNEHLANEAPVVGGASMAAVSDSTASTGSSDDSAPRLPRDQGMSPPPQRDRFIDIPRLEDSSPQPTLYDAIDNKQRTWIMSHDRSVAPSPSATPSWSHGPATAQDRDMAASYEPPVGVLGDNGGRMPLELAVPALVVGTMAGAPHPSTAFSGLRSFSSSEFSSMRTTPRGDACPAGPSQFLWPPPPQYASQSAGGYFGGGGTADGGLPAVVMSSFEAPASPEDVSAAQQQQQL